MQSEDDIFLDKTLNLTICVDADIQEKNLQQKNIPQNYLAMAQTKEKKLIKY